MNKNLFSLNSNYLQKIDNNNNDKDEYDYNYNDIENNNLSLVHGLLIHFHPYEDEVTKAIKIEMLVE